MGIWSPRGSFGGSAWGRGVLAVAPTTAFFAGVRNARLEVAGRENMTAERNLRRKQHSTGDRCCQCSGEQMEEGAIRPRLDELVSRA